MKYVIVMRPFAHLYEEFQVIFEETPDIQVILDRRYGERRQAKIPPVEDRRAGRGRRREDRMMIPPTGPRERRQIWDETALWEGSPS